MSSYTSREDEDFFGAIGRLTISWAHLEFGLDCMVEIYHHGLDGKAVEPEIPRALKRKLQYLRAVTKRHTEILGGQALENYLSLFDQITANAQIRHDIIHGIVIEQVESSGEATMVRTTRGKNGITKRQYTVTTRSILEAAREAQKLGTKVFYWLNRMNDSIEELLKQRDGQNPS